MLKIFGVSSSDRIGLQNYSVFLQSTRTNCPFSCRRRDVGNLSIDW